MLIRLSVLEISKSKVSLLPIFLHVFYTDACDRDEKRLSALFYVFLWAEFNGEKILSLGLSLFEIYDLSDFSLFYIQNQKINILYLLFAVYIIYTYFVYIFYLYMNWEKGKI